MIVSHCMTRELVTISKEASIQEALAVMKRHSIRHLPVVDTEKTLLGWVTDADLRGVLIASMLEELTLEDVMVRKPYTAHPDMPLDEAAQIILEKRIGGCLRCRRQTDRDHHRCRYPVRLHHHDGDVHPVFPAGRQNLSAPRFPARYHPFAPGPWWGNHQHLQFASTGRRYASLLDQAEKIDLKPILADLKAKGIQVVSFIP